MKLLRLLALLGLLSSTASAVPLETWSTWINTYPSAARAVTPAAMIARGIGTNVYYVLEVDPTTGEIPVSLSGASISIDYSGPTGDPVPADAAYVGGIGPTGDLTGLRVDANGELQVDVLTNILPTGAASAAKQDDQTALLTTIDADTGAIATSTASIDTKTPALGQALMAASVPVVIASNQSAIAVNSSNLPTTADTNFGTPGASTLRTASMLGVGATAVSNANPVPISDAGGVITVDGTVATSNLPATVDTNAGASSASTLRVTTASRTYADSVNNAYASTNVTTGAWVELIASTAAAINLLCVTDTGGQVMELGTGAAASETRVLLIATGWSGCVPLRIAASTRLAVRAVTATANTGNLTISGMN